VGRHITPLRHIIPIPSQPSLCSNSVDAVCLATNTNFTVCGLIRPHNLPHLPFHHQYRYKH